MKIGVTGHQDRRGISWPWVSSALRTFFEDLSAPIEGLSCLASGADQVFANAVLETGGRLTAVIPQPDYERHFSPESAREYRRLLSKASVIRLPSTGDDQTDFLQASKFIVERCDLLVAVWDGKRSRGRGGTADVVDHALARNISIYHINPVAQTVRELHSGK